MASLFEEQRDRENLVHRNRENRGRSADVFAEVTSTGQGTYIFDERITFGLTAIHKPTFSAGYEIDLDDWADSLGVDAGDMDSLPLPSVTCFVTGWDQDDRDFYVGAYVAVSVYFPLTEPGAIERVVPVDAQPVITHHLRFSAVSLKDVPTDLDQ